MLYNWSTGERVDHVARSFCAPDLGLLLLDIYLGIGIDFHLRTTDKIF